MENSDFVTRDYLKSILPQRGENTHKGSFGSVLNVAGSINYRGAAFLSTKSALKVGAGYVGLAAIEKIVDYVSTLCPEAVFHTLKEKKGTIAEKEYKKIVEILPKYKVLSIGCGISSLNENQTEIEGFIKNLFREIKNAEKAVVIDADGLNIISKLKIIDLPKKTILTPHPTELSRLLGIEVDKIQNERENYAKLTAQKYGTVVVLKGYNSVITDGERVLINPTGNSALSKAGTGDILTGMISGFLAQGAGLFEGAVLGAYLHGLTGEIASQKLTKYSVNASDLIEFIHEGIKAVVG